MSKSWHCSATKTISRIRVIEVEQEFERVSSKCHQENCFLSWPAATQEPLIEELDSSPASPSWKTPALPLYAQLLLPLTGLSFQSQNVRTRFDLAYLTQASTPSHDFPTVGSEGRHTGLGTSQGTHDGSGNL